jgi:GAF domain-containing protein
MDDIAGRVLGHLGLALKSDESRVLRLLLDIALETLPAAEASLLVAAPGGRELVFAMTQGGAKANRKLIGQRVPLGSGITGLAAVSREVQAGVPTFTPSKKGAVKRAGKAPSAVIAAPMLVDDELVGVLTAVRFPPSGTFQTRELRVFGQFAAVAAVVVEQRRAIRGLEVLGGAKPLAAVTEREAAEQELATVVAELVAKSGGRTDRVVRALKAFGQAFE